MKYRFLITKYCLLLLNNFKDQILKQRQIISFIEIKKYAYIINNPLKFFYYYQQFLIDSVDEQSSGVTDVNLLNTYLSSSQSKLFVTLLQNREAKNEISENIIKKIKE